MNKNSIKIFSTRLDNLCEEQIRLRIEKFLHVDTFVQIATLNPEILLMSYKNKKFRDVLNACDLTIADGFGAHLAAWHRSVTLNHRYSGVDLTWDLLGRADQKNLGVFLIANKNGLSTWQETAQTIKKTYPKLKIDGINTNRQPSDDDQKLMIKKLQTESHKLVFCNFGAPHQEIFLNSLKNAKIGSIRLGVGVGGTFDYISGKRFRAPKWMRMIGCEWLFRLVTQPQRIKRIVNAVIVFPLKVFLQRD